jgi:ribosomal protein S18 acetylase RimI-like enzyme
LVSCQGLSRIRRGRADDSKDCARLVLESAEHFLPAVFGPLIGAALERLAAGRGTLFSHEHLRISETADSHVAGALLGYGGRQKAAEDPRTGLALMGLLGWDMLKRLGKLLRFQGTIGKIGRLDYYVSNVAVYREFRGRGIGAALLADAEERAARDGCAAVVLDVETDNDAALRLYRRFGFRELWKTPPVALDGALFSFYRMAKPLG